MAGREQDDLRAKKHAPAPWHEIGPPDWAGLRDETGRQARRAATLRVAGVLGFLLSALVLLTFGLGTLSELQKSVAVEDAIHRRWIARMTCVLTLATVAAAANLALFRLRNWARLTVTIFSLLPVAVLVGDMAVFVGFGKVGPRGGLGLEGLTTLFLLTVACIPLPLYFLWSPVGKDVFSRGQGKKVVDETRSDPGFVGTLDGIAFALSELGSCFVLTFAVLSLLADLGVIRSF